MDEYPNGTNAVVAVLSYTGFDMEDAMILNKSSYERGFGHASVYKTIMVDLQEETEKLGGSTGGKARVAFGNAKIQGRGFRRKHGTGEAADGTNDSQWEYSNLSEDGLPHVGMQVKEGEAIYSVLDSLTGKSRAGKHKEKEPAYIQTVRRLGSNSSTSLSPSSSDKASITMRFNRNPVIGDKFSSRHGQKGVMSILWPQHNFRSMTRAIRMLSATLANSYRPLGLATLEVSRCIAAFRGALCMQIFTLEWCFISDYGTWCPTSTKCVPPGR
jgi:DNA-directed RNA polymerase I subunit RPA2